MPIKAYKSDVPQPWPTSTDPLDQFEETELLRRWKESGDTAARDRVIQGNIRFVISVAREYQGRGLPISDLVAEGVLGMMTATDRFDPTADLNLSAMRSGGSGKRFQRHYTRRLPSRCPTIICKNSAISAPWNRNI